MSQGVVCGLFGACTKRRDENLVCLVLINLLIDLLGECGVG